MSALDELALSGIEGIARRLGPRAALRALVPLLDALPAGRGRARALLRAVGYAAESGDAAQLEQLCARWITEGVSREAKPWIRQFAKSRPDAAVHLAHAELERTRGTHEEARASYALGRSYEAARRMDEALEAYERAERLASDQPRLRQGARARIVRTLSKLGRSEEAARRAALLLPLERAAPEERFAVAVAALDAPGRYRRAMALDVLDELARTREELRRDAVRFAAWHAERAGPALSRIEADRIEAVLSHHSKGAAACAQLSALRAGAFESGPLLARARAMLGGGTAGPRPDGTARETLAWLALAACAALRSERPSETAESLRELKTQLNRGARVEAPIWTAAMLALAERHTREEGLALASMLLERNGEPPPRGFVRLAEELELADAPELALRAWRRAAARREPTARERLATLLRWRGWQAAEAQERETAIAYLEEARRWAGADRP